MADNKQYITQTQENGSVLISLDVISKIVCRAITDTEGVVGLSSKPGADIADFIGKNWGKGVKIVIGENNALTVDCNVLVTYGASVVTVAQEIQSNVKSALESVTGVKVLAVNVNVCGIARK